MVKDSKWVYDRLVCEFDHYDYCFSGLIKHRNKFWFVKVNEFPEGGSRNAKYAVSNIDWNAECEEYLADYRVAYAHCFHEKGRRPAYNGWPLAWFTEKWDRRNPIEEQAK